MNKIKVLVIDDSAVIRQIICKSLSFDNQIEVIGEAEDPYQARDLIKELNPDILTLDVEMPKMDGITFLKNLMRLRPMPVLMLSTLTTKGADITFEALELGAIDFISKPTVEDLLADQKSFSEVLIDKIKSAAFVDQKNYQLSQINQKNEASLSFTGHTRLNHLIAIGASTGGTEAIRTILKQLPSNSPPIVIAQHIPKNFSHRFATRLNEHCELTVQEAQHGQKLKQGHVYIAPGGEHLTVIKKSNALFCQLNEGELVNRHRPSVDVLFQSLEPFADNVQALLLTGMGQDGASAMLNLKKLGAHTVVQDKATSLIWGMPGSAHAIDAHCEVHSINDIAAQLLTFAEHDSFKEKVT